MTAMICCTSTGTLLCAETCVILPDHALSSSEWDELENASDSEICAIGKERGLPLTVSDSQALDAVAALLSSQDWSSDHIEAVAELVRSTGRTIEDVQ